MPRDLTRERHAHFDLTDSVCCHGNCNQGRACPLHRRSDAAPRLPMVFDDLIAGSNAISRHYPRARRPGRRLTFVICAAAVFGLAALVLYGPQLLA